MSRGGGSLETTNVCCYTNDLSAASGLLSSKKLFSDHVDVIIHGSTIVSAGTTRTPQGKGCHHPFCAELAIIISLRTNLYAQ
jgi:hypothetical protein